MNIFLIPSWYPVEENILSGSFTKEQSLMISEVYKNDLKYFVSFISSYSLSPKSIKQSVVNVRKIINKKDFLIDILSNYTEYHSSCLSWSSYLFEGNLTCLLKKHREHIKSILKQNNNIDVIHAHVSYPAGYIAYRLSKEFDIPYIITEHMGPFPFEAYKKHNEILNKINLAMENSNEIIAVSNSLKKDIQRFGIKKEPIVIHNFIDDDLYKTEDVHNDRFIVLTVGSMSEQKGIDILLKAISKMSDIDTKIEFRIVGDGPNKDNYIYLANRYNISNKVKFLGKLNRTNTIEEFKKCNLFVLPSRHESFGVVYIEALACGKPIIATKCGGPEDIVNEYNGVLIDKGDYLSLSKVIINTIKNYSKYDFKILRDDYLNRFSKKLNTQKYFDLYKKVSQCAE